MAANTSHSSEGGAINSVRMRSYLVLYCCIVYIFCFFTFFFVLFSSWISVLTNSKEEALNMAFRGEQSSGGEDGLEDLTKAIIEDVLRMPGNEVCCDCGAAGV